MNDELNSEQPKVTEYGTHQPDDLLPNFHHSSSISTMARPGINILDLFEEEDESDDFPSALPSDFTDATESTDDSDLNETLGESEGGEYTDAQEDLDPMEIEITTEDDEGDQTETEDNGTQTSPRTTTQDIPMAVLARLINQNAPLRRLFESRFRIVNVGGNDNSTDDADDDEDSDDRSWTPYGRRRRKPKFVGEKYPKIPSVEGQELMNSGTYGQRDHFMDLRRKRRSTVAERLMWRRLGLDARGSARRQNRLLSQQFVPKTTVADKIVHYDSRAYSGQFSDDGNFFFSCTQNFKVRMYDTSNPYEWKYYKTVDYPFGQWTITDATLSPDNKFLAYSSIRHTVCLAATDPSDHSEPAHLNLLKGTDGSRGGMGYMGRHGFGIWSLRFSGDGREIVAGTSDSCVVVYDLERRESVLKLSNHNNDVNAVCFGDISSPHILFSGSDDQTLRVWDRRSMADGREAGVFVGHTEGLTYVDSKGDGRYVLSNGKDQTMKLWDLRKMYTPHQFDQMDIHNFTSNFDYRFSPYDEDDYYPNPKDCSVVTFRGHSVLKTLIRCHFSPPGSTNSRYVYSGSEDGKVWIWNLDATPRATIDVGAATKNTRPRHSVGDGGLYDYHTGRHGTGWSTCVRDASWSPTAPIIAGMYFILPSS